MDPKKIEEMSATELMETMKAAWEADRSVEKTSEFRKLVMILYKKMGKDDFWQWIETKVWPY